METRQYRIARERFDVVEKKLNRIINKCKKYNCEYTFEVVGSEYINVSKERYVEDMREFLVIEVSGEIKHDNYKVIGRYELSENGTENLVTSFGDEEMPTRYRTADCFCEHCNTNRRRKYMYVVQDLDTSEYKQIGATCVQEYTHGLSLDFVGAVNDLQTLCRELSDNSEYKFKRINRCIPVTDIILYSMTLEKSRGYMKNDTKYIITDICTYGLEYVIQELNRNPRFDTLHLDDFTYNDKDKETARMVVEYFLAKDDTSDLMHNVKTLLNAGYVDRKHIGYIAWLYHSYLVDEKKREEERERENRLGRGKTSEHFGEVGKRYRGMLVDVQIVAKYETLYGLYRVYKMTNADGCVFIWKTANGYDEGRYTVDLSVKGHSEYNGIKQTDVTRCKLVAI